MITKKQIEAYLKDSVHCPFCGSENIEAGQFDVSEGDKSAWQNVWCNDCKKRWQDVYTLTSIEEDVE